MKILFKSKDGGSESNVTGYWLFESKRFGSIVLLRFDKGSREAFHNHAFNAVSWVIKGVLLEMVMRDPNSSAEEVEVDGYVLRPSLCPIYTPKERMHKVFGVADKTWAISFRGPWNKTWNEYLPATDENVTLTNGRKIVSKAPANG